MFNYLTNFHANTEYIRKPIVSEDVKKLLKEGKYTCSKCAGHDINLYAGLDEETSINDVRKRFREIIASSEIVDCPVLLRMGLAPTDQALVKFERLPYNGQIEALKVVTTCGPHYPSFISALRVKDKGFVYAEQTWRVAKTKYELVSSPGETREVQVGVVPVPKRAIVGEPIEIAVKQ